VTLGRLVVAWILVTIWFYVATVVSPLAAAYILQPPGTSGVMGSMPVPLFRWRVIEAGVLTLFASLWFDSLGSGEWWLVFLLVGLLVTVPIQLLMTVDAPRRRAAFALSEIAELVRYLVAGALLAWRLS
jgi:hypothetical protein